MTIQDQRRKGFESWWQIIRPQTSKTWAWNCWNAALDSVVIELPRESLNNRPYNQGIYECRMAIEAAGLKTK